jgi:tetratricopeptide (TPR) repeat protein
LGRNAASIEQHYQAALRVYSESDTPWHWAQTCLRLERLHSAMRANGSQQAAQHALSGVQYLEGCLRVWTKEWNPTDWANTQDTLGVLFSAVDGADQKRAIACYEEALKVYRRQSFPRDYGIVQWNLGRAYQAQARGAPENLTRAIEAYEEASATMGDPLKWAALQDLIGECIRGIQTGDRAVNIRRAIEQSERALTEFTEHSHASDWAFANELLGWAHLEARLISGDDQLSAATTCFEAALRVNTRSRSPFRWAALQDGLGWAYQFLESGDRLENLSKAAMFAELALEEFPRPLYPTDWAVVQGNLGNIQLARFEAGVADAAQLAITHFEQALEVYASAQDAHHSSIAQINLGAAYRALGDLEQALSLQTTGVAAIDRSVYPQTHADAVFELALTYKQLVLGGENTYEAQYQECLAVALQFYDALRFPTRHRQILSRAANGPIVVR